MTEAERLDWERLRSSWATCVHENLVLRRRLDARRLALEEAQLQRRRMVTCLLVGAGAGGLTLGALAALLVVS